MKDAKKIIKSAENLYFFTASEKYKNNYKILCALANPASALNFFGFQIAAIPLKDLQRNGSRSFFMPTYEYFCTSCGKTIEAFQKITAEPLKNCESCQKETLVRKPGGGIGLSFSRGGDGFYTNMYGQNRQSSETSSSSASEEGCCPCGKNKSACSSNANDKG